MSHDNSQETEANPLQWALVRYKNKKLERVPLSSVYEEYINSRGKTRTKLINPQHSTDFITSEYYVVKTQQDLRKGEPPTSFYARIGKLGETKESVSELLPPRVRWLTFDDDDEEPADTSSQEEAVPGTSLSGLTVLQNERSQKKAKKNCKRKSAEEDLNTFIHNNPLEDLVGESHESESIHDLRKRLKTLEKAMGKDKQPTESGNTFPISELKEFFSSKLDDLQRTVKKEIATIREEHEKTVVDLKKQIDDMQNALSSQLSSSRSMTATTSGISMNSDEEITLGPNIKVLKRDYSRLQFVQDNHSDWALALLKCVFKDKAHLMRVKPTKASGNEAFKPEFITTARIMYREWLKKQKIPLDGGDSTPRYTEEKVEELVGSLPAYLAKKAEDLKGPRGINAKVQAALKEGRDPKELVMEHQAKRATVAAATKKRKPYTRRGALPVTPQTQLAPEHDPNPVLTVPVVVPTQPTLTEPDGTVLTQLLPVNQYVGTGNSLGETGTVINGALSTISTR